MDTSAERGLPGDRTGEITLHPSGVSIRGPIGSTFLRVLQENGLSVGSSCGGHETCGECRIRFVDRSPEPSTSDRTLIEPDAIADGWRLACAHELSDAARIEVPERVGDLRSKERAGDEALACGAEPSEGRAKALGLAIDVGTTTLSIGCFDLATGELRGLVATRNPQRRFGADVISRIAHVRRSKDAGLNELQAAVVEGLNGLVDRLSAEAKIALDSIERVTIVGNPTMLHLLLRVDPAGIGISPYRPAFRDSVRRPAGDLGLEIPPRTPVETLPGVSGYVGADIVGGILATGLDVSSGRTLFLDVGTNGEIVAAIDRRLIACSTAAGPAFEGAAIVQGMPAYNGAIEAVRISDDGIACDVIGGGAPAGLCGTGLVAAVAELYKAAGIEASGRFCDPGAPLSERFEGAGKERRFRLTGEPAVCLHQADVREFQLAKAAIRTGIEILLQQAALRPDEIDRVLIAGAFSERLCGEHLVATGLLPAIDPSRIDVVGNTAGQGAARVLLDPGLMDQAETLARSIEYVELSADPRFSELYVEQIPFPE